MKLSRVFKILFQNFRSEIENPSYMNIGPFSAPKKRLLTTKVSRLKQSGSEKNKKIDTRGDRTLTSTTTYSIIKFIKFWKSYTVYCIGNFLFTNWRIVTLKYLIF